MQKNRKTILLVEDDPLIITTEAHWLKREGYNILKSSTGEYAIQTVEENSGSIDLILMDIDLGPGIDGTEAAKNILKKYDIPILFLSAHTEKEIVEKTEKITSYGYVVKDANNSVLFASIKMAFKLHESYKKLAEKEARLKVSEEKFSKAFHTSPDSININRYKDGVYIDINEGFTQITGYSKEEVIGRSSLPGDLGIWVNAFDRQKLLDGLEKNGEVVGLEAPFRKKNGEVIIGLMSAKIIEINNEKCILTATRDITTLKNTEEALRRSNEKFLGIFNSINDAVFINDSSNGTILDVNLKATELYGYSKEELKKLSIAQLSSGIHPYTQTEALKKISAAKSGTAQNFNWHAKRKNGELFWTDISLRSATIDGIDSVVVVVRGIDDSEKIEKLLNESTEKFKRIFESGPLAMAMADTSFHLFESNKVFQEMLGYSQEELKSLTFKEITHHDDLAKDIQNTTKLTKGLISIYKTEKRYIKKNKEVVWGNLTVSMVNDYDGNFLYYLILIEDITKRKLSELELEKTALELQNFFDLALDLFCIANTEGYFIHLNPSWEKTLGYSLEELKRCKFLDYVHPDDLESTLSTMTLLTKQKEITNFVNRYRCKDGSYRWIEWRSHPVNNLIYAAARDITERKQYEEALRESEAKYRILLEESLDPIFIIGSDGTYYYVNKAFAQGVNREINEVIGKKIWEVFPPLEAEQRFSAMRSVIKTGETKIIEVKVETVKGLDYYVTTIQPIKKDDGSVVSVMCSSKNISERKQMEEALKSSEEKFSKFFYSNPDGLSINKVETSEFVEINPGFAKLFGYTKEEIIGHTANKHDLNLWLDDLEREKMYNEFNENGEIIGLEVLCRRKDGTIFTGLISAKIVDIKGVQYRLTTNVDISAQKELEKLLKQSAEEKELLLRELQHRIKNNLNVLSGLLSIASENLNDEKSQNVFADALSRINTMSTIYKQLYKSPDFNLVNLKIYLSELVETLFDTYNVKKDKIKLITNFQDVTLDVKNTEPLGLILNELISNSLKYAFRDRAEGIVKVNLEKIENEIILTVSDNGIGLPDNFNISKTESLGLKLVKLLTDQLKGKLTTENINGLSVKIAFQIQ